MDEEYQRMAANSIAHEAFCAGQAWQQAAAAQERPCVLWKPRLFRDGSQWCALLGENIQDGVVGFGDSPDAAMWAFDEAWREKLPPASGAQPAPSVPEGWLRAIDEALIVAHIGMASADDTYAQAKSKLDTLIGLHGDIATDPAVNGGWKLVPTAESRHPGIHKMLNALHAADNTPGASEWESYAAFLAAAPEAKP